MSHHPSTMGRRPEPGDQHLVHTVCCEYDSISLCGFDVSKHEHTSDSAPTGCVVCAELERNDYFCPVKPRCL